MGNAKSATPKYSMVRHIVHILAGLILLAVLGFLCFKIYQTMITPPNAPTTAATRYVEEPTADGHTPPPTHPAASFAPEVDSEYAKRLKALKAMDPVFLDGTEEMTIFRSPGSNEVCTITTDLATVASNHWIVPWKDANGQIPSGPGVMCSMVDSVPINQGDIGSCTEGTVVRGTATLFSEGPKYGGCLTEASTPLYRDGVTENTHERFNVPPLVIYTSVSSGDITCGSEGSTLICMNRITGQGFEISATSYTLF